MVTFEQIQNLLREKEKEHDICILYACEAGSRAWGFESRDSDYDIRFIYAKPLEWYLSISEQPRDVIEYVKKEKDIDLVGWELRKALRLLKKVNPALMEWIHSDIVYMSDEPFMIRLNLAAEDYYASKPLLHHCLHMARGNIREYLKSSTEVWLKKYLYVVRPLMACNWLKLFGTMPPVNFERLYTTVIPAAPKSSKWFSRQLLGDLNDLLLRKKGGDELSFGPIIPSIHHFIEKEVEELTAEEKAGGKKWPKLFSSKKDNDLNSLLYNTIKIFEKSRKDLT